MFSDIFGKTSKEILLHFQSAEDFENITSEQLESVLENVSFKKFAKSKISCISEPAATSFGLKFCRDSFSLQLKLLIEQIQFIEAQVTDVESEIAIILDKIDSPITTYQKKRSEGKHHLTAIGAVARKLCNTIFAVLKYNKPYEVQL